MARTRLALRLAGLDFSEPGVEFSESEEPPIQPSRKPKRPASVSASEQANKKRRGSVAAELLYTNCEVTITLDGSIAFRIQEQDLKARCAFFKQYQESPFPNHFRLQGDGNLCHLVPETTGEGEDMIMSCVTEPKSTIKAFEVLFEVVCQKIVGVQFEMRDFIDAAKLAAKLNVNSAISTMLMNTMMFSARNYHDSDESLCDTLEASYHLRDLSTFCVLVPQVVMKKPKLGDSFLSMPESLKYIVNVEQGKMICDMRTGADKVLRLLGDSRLAPESEPVAELKWVYQRIWDTKDDDSRHKEFINALRILKSCVENGMFGYIDDGRSESAKRVLKRLRAALDRCFDYEEASFYTSTIPWDV